MKLKTSSLLYQVIIDGKEHERMFLTQGELDDFLADIYLEENVKHVEVKSFRICSYDCNLKHHFRDEVVVVTSAEAPFSEFGVFSSFDEADSFCIDYVTSHDDVTEFNFKTTSKFTKEMLK